MTAAQIPITKNFSAPQDLPERVRAAANRIMSGARDVAIKEQRIPDVLGRLKESGIESWIRLAPVRFDDLSLENQLMVALVFNSISFCYWPKPWWDNPWYDTKVRRGSWAMLAAIRHALEQGHPLLSCQFLAGISEDALAGLLGGAEPPALLSRRAAILREVGVELSRNFDGSMLHLVEACRRDAVLTAEFVVRTFPSFRDASIWHGKEAPFYKRAQLLAADCHRLVESRDGRGLTRFSALTACADYMLPAVLAAWGLLEYSEALEEAIMAKRTIEAGSQWELEIRAATIVACDALSSNWGEPPMVVNDALWMLAGDILASSQHHHLTYSDAY